MAYEDLLKDTSVADPSNNYFTLTITDLNPNTSYPIQLRWKYKDGTFSNWGAVKRLDAKTLLPKPSELPSTPTVKPVVGAIELAWNGKTSTGENQPFGFNSAKVYIGTTSGFTPTDSGTSKNQIDILNFADGQNVINIGVGTVVNSSFTLTYGTDYYVKIKTTNGNAAEDSVSVAATGNPVRIGQISNDGLIEVKADKITTGTLNANATVTVGATTGKHVVLSGGSSPILVYGSGGLNAGPILDLDSSGNLLIKGIITATGGSFTGPISINGTGGSMKIGKEAGQVNGTGSYLDGLYMGANNYWYNDGIFKVGNGDKNLTFENGNLSIVNKGTINSIFGPQNVTTTLNTNGLFSIITDGDDLFDFSLAAIEVGTQVKHSNIYPGSIRISLDDSDENQTQFTGSSFSISNDGQGNAVLAYSTEAASNSSGVIWANYNWGSSTKVNQFMWGRQSLTSDSIRSLVVDSSGYQWVGHRNFYGNNSSTTMSNSTIGVDGDFYFSTNEN
jgi:hypothetical protein